MSSAKTFFGVVLALTAAALLVYFARPLSAWIVHRFGPALTPPTVLAEVVKTTGPVFIRPGPAGQFRPLRVGESLLPKDEVKTEREGRLLIRSTTGYELELTPETQMTLDHWTQNNGPQYFSVARGSFQLVKSGQAGRLFIMSEGRMYAPEKAPVLYKDSFSIQLNSSHTTTSSAGGPAVNPPAPQPIINRRGQPMPDKGLAEESTTLSNSYIESVLIGRAPLFRRCQLTSVRDKGNSSGLVTVAFRVLNDGRTDQARVVSSTLLNAALEACVVDVLSRTQFKAFTGEPLYLSYPLRFQ
jgi:hypothetical protein